jgi:hypothetical protein
MRIEYRTRLLYAALGAVLVSACDSGGSQEPPPTPAITVSVAATSAEVLPGGTTTMAVNVTRSGGFTGEVTVFAVEGVPPGVNFSVVTIPSGATSGTINIAAAANASPATSTVTIRATGTGVTAQTATFTLTVREPPGFALTLNPSSVSVLPGATATTTVNIARTGGFTGAVALTAAGLPTGVTASFDPASATGTTSTMTLTAAAGTAAATHSITVQGNASNMTQRTATLSVQVAAAPTIGIALNPATLSVAQGASGTVAVNLTRGGGFAGAVTVRAEGLPPGVTIADATIAAGANSANLTVSATAAAALAASNITIRALGSGVADATATLGLTVTAAAGFTLSVNPASLSIQQGASGTATVGLARTGGFTGAVNLTASGAPGGMTVSFNPASVTADQSTVTVSTTSAVAPGTYALTIQGAATGQPNRTATLTVTVTGGQTGGNVVWQFCPVSGVPIWVAAQDGTGAWTRVMGNANHEYTFQITNNGGIAYVIDNGGGNFSLTVAYGTRQELQTQGSGMCQAGTGQTKTINGTVSGLGEADLAFIGLGSSSTIVVPFLGLNFQLQDVEPGPVDLVGARLDATFRTNRLFIQRNLNPPNNSSVTVDFTGPNSFDPATANLTLGNLAGDEALVTSSFVTSNGTFTFLGFEADASTATTRQYTGVPADRQVAGDLHWIMGIASAPGVENPTHMRMVIHVFQTLADRAFSFGAAMSAVTPTVVASQPYARIRLSYPVQADYNSFWSAAFSQSTRDASVSMTTGYAGGAGTVNLEVPNFSGVAGWMDTWGLRPGFQTEWSMTAVGVPAGSILNPFADNTVLRMGLRSGQITP